MHGYWEFRNVPGSHRCVCMDTGSLGMYLALTGVYAWILGMYPAIN